MKTVIEMAGQAFETPGTEPAFRNGFWTVTQEELERFAELVRADEREKYKWDVHSCGPTCKLYACVAMREAVEAERKAIAQSLDKQADLACDAFDRKWAQEMAAAVRARSNT